MATLIDLTTNTSETNYFTGFETTWSDVSDDQLYSIIPEFVKNHVRSDIAEMIANSDSLSPDQILIGKTGPCRHNHALSEFINREIKKSGCHGGVLTQTEEYIEEVANNRRYNEVVYDVTTCFADKTSSSTHEINFMIGSVSSKKTVLGPELTPEQNEIILVKRAEALAEYNTKYPDAHRDTTFENINIGIVMTPNFISEQNLEIFEYYLRDALMLCEVLCMPVKSSKKAICSKDLTECRFTNPNPEQLVKLEAIWKMFIKLGFHAIVPNRKIDKIGGSWCNELISKISKVMVGWEYSSSQKIKYIKRINHEIDSATGEVKEVVEIERLLQPLNYIGDHRLMNTFYDKLVNMTIRDNSYYLNLISKKSESESE